MKIRFLLAASWLIASAAFAQETAYTNRVTELRAAPDVDAKVLQSLPDKAAVQIIERKGAWSRVQVPKGNDKETGWVRMMHLRGGVVVADAPPASGGGGFLSGFNKLLGGNQNSNMKAQSATVGIRGLSPEEITNAQPNAQALVKMKTFKADKPEGEKFAKEASLARADVPELGDAAKGGRK
jgi:hypothetical protein